MDAPCIFISVICSNSECATRKRIVKANDPERVHSAKLNLSIPLLDRKRILLLLGLGVLTFALLVKLGGGLAMGQLITRAHWGLIALAILIHYSGFAVRGHRWQLLLGTMGHRLSYIYATTLLISGWFISALIPARAGDAARVYLLHAPLQKAPKQSAGSVLPSVPVADSLGSILLERLLDILAILLLGVGFGYFVLRDALPSWVLIAYAAAVTLLFVFGLLLLLSPAVVRRLRGLSAAPLWQKALGFGDEIANSLRRLPQNPSTMVVVIGESLYIWLCDALLLWLVLCSLSAGSAMATVNFPSAAFVALTVDIVAAIPLTPGGIGQIESAYAALLRLLGIPLIVVTSVTLLTRLVSYWSFLIFSGVVTFAAGIGQLFISGQNEQPKRETGGAERSMELPR